MKAICRMALAAFMGLALTVAIAGHGIAQQHTRSVKQQLVGTWLVASASFMHLDGTPFGASAGATKGILMFDRTGHFSFELVSEPRRAYAAQSHAAVMLEENKTVASRVIAYFGTYSVDATGHTLTFHVDRHTFPDWDGKDLKRTITLAGDELTYSNPKTVWDSKSVIVWKRVK